MPSKKAWRATRRGGGGATPPVPAPAWLGRVVGPACLPLGLAGPPRGRRHGRPGMVGWCWCGCGWQRWRREPVDVGHSARREMWVFFFFLRSGVANSIRRIGEKIDATARHSPLFFAHTRAPTTNSRPVRPRQPPTLPRLCAMAAVGGDTIVRWREREKKGARFFGSLSHQKLTPPLSLLPVSPPRSSSSPTAPSSASWWRTWTTWRP